MARLTALTASRAIRHDDYAIPADLVVLILKLSIIAWVCLKVKDLVRVTSSRYDMVEGPVESQWVEEGSQAPRDRVSSSDRHVSVLNHDLLDLLNA
jgi:hypothetical protein